MPAVPAPRRAMRAQLPVRGADPLELLVGAAKDDQLGRALHEVHHVGGERARAVAWRASSRRASRPVSHGAAVAETTSATSRTSPAWGRNHHSAATVAPPTRTATAKGWITRSTTSWSESTSSTTRATRSPRRKAGRPAGASASSRVYTRTREVGQQRSAASWPTSRSP